MSGVVLAAPLHQMPTVIRIDNGHVIGICDNGDGLALGLHPRSMSLLCEPAGMGTNEIRRFLKCLAVLGCLAHLGHELAVGYELT
jgi:hypothetical protein